MAPWLVRLILLPGLIVLLAGCGLRPADPDPEPVPVALEEGSPAAALLERAREARENEQWHAAGRYLERALDLQPGSAVLYRELARLRLDQDEPGAAEGLALRALRQAPEAPPEWRAGVWELIAEARFRQGREPEAREAFRRAEELEGQR